MRKRRGKILGLLLITGMLVGCSSKNLEKEKKHELETITIWNYYNGAQKEAFDELVQEFNETIGKEKNIAVESVSKGTLQALIDEIEESAEGKIGSDKLPQLSFSYADTAMKLDEQGLLADMRPYMEEKELDSYVEAYVKEGEFLGDGSWKIFPIAKSTEILTINMTAWEPFAKETGAELSELATWEGIAQTAEAYYAWTDAQTSEIGDGKAFFGRDAMANYILLGSSQLGHEIVEEKNGKVTLDFDRETMKKLWDMYYVPYVKGYYIAEGKFRSDDLKMGNLVSYVGSTSGVAYTPKQVVYEDGSSETIVCDVLPVPNFEGKERTATQQGSGIVMFKEEESTERAAVEFLKWFTQKEKNLQFCIASGYLPVRKDANDAEFLKTTLEKSEGKDEMPEIFQNNLLIGMETVHSYKLYTTKPFAFGNDVRNVLEVTMAAYAKEDREKAKQMIQSGTSMNQLEEALHTEERFSEWYEETYNELKEFVK